MKIYIAKHRAGAAPTLTHAAMCDTLDSLGFLVDGRYPRDCGFADEYECMYSHKRAGRDEQAALAKASATLGRAVFFEEHLHPLLAVFAAVTGPNGETLLEQETI
ncbi:hypothetical protein [Paraburkholderia humisilvae]|uniref:Uncharacterized protein n=1 Tax=Paraburkholderia humisilvae TaxID=627669 RepID=A0A6J5CWT8_9BURK|nr:hypothetical protein [Paraburkholderia humisilvae]CAB3746448.1 hypothetical protein LMG29542_00213 [Paraburkholderia humisilvae]